MLTAAALDGIRPSTRRPRVVIDGRFIQDHFPGVGRFCYSVIDALTRIDEGLDFIVPCAPAGLNTRFDTAALSRGHVTVVPVDVPVFSVREQVAMPFFARKVGADLWHSPHPAAPLLLPCPRVVNCHDAIPLQHPESLASGWRRPAASYLLRRSVRAARAVLTSSAAAKRDVITLFGAPAERTVVIPHGVGGSFAPQPEESVAEVRARYRLPVGYALHLSSGKPHKNLDRLLDAWQAATSDGSVRDLVLAVAGDAGSSRRSERAGLDSTSRRSSVRFVGPVREADLPALYSGARFFVFPSLWEGFGLPVLEAMACGTPVVCSNTSSLPEVAGEAAVFFDPRDVRTIAAAIARVAGDAGLRAGLRANGLNRAEGFSWEVTARKCTQVYRRVLSPTPEPAERRNRS